MLRKKRFWGLNVLTAAMFLLVACQSSGGTTGSTGQPTAAPAGGGPPAGVKQEFTLGNLGEPESLDPALMTDNISSNIAYQVYEGLTTFDPSSLEAREGVASKWDISGDGKTVTFTLRGDAKFSNGDPVTADDFAYSWLRVLNPSVNAGKPSPYADKLTSYLVNAADYNSGKLTDATQVGVKAKDKNTLVVSLVNPTAYFLQVAAFHTLMPVHKATVEKFGKDWTKPENFVGNGAFKLSEWKDHDHITVVKNPNYWDAKKVYFDKVTFLPVEDNDTSLAQYEKSEIEWMRTIPPKAIDSWKGKPDYHNDSALILQYLRFNITHKPLDDVRVRKALSLAIDRQAIVDKIVKAGNPPARTAVPPGLTAYAPVAPKGLTEDAAQAKKLLADAGFPDGKGFPKLTVIYNTNATHKLVYEFIQQQWKEKLGIDVNVENQEQQVKLKNIRDMNYDMARDGWIGDYPDPNTFLGDLWTTGNGNNNTGFSNKQFDDLIKQAAANQDKAARFKQLAQAEKIVVEDELPIAPIYFGNNLNLVKPWIKGMGFNVLDIHYLKGVYTEGKK
jgi:oligopeptide transport system substrate-binding protein